MAAARTQYDSGKSKTAEMGGLKGLCPQGWIF
jgi:hypothetical protein